MPLCTGLVILTPWLRALNLSIVNSTIGPIITDSKDVLTSDVEKASYFNEFFINISEELTKN